MRNHNDDLIPDPKDHIKYLVGCFGIQIACRLVKYKDIIIMEHKPRNIDPLLFAERDLPGIGSINLLADKLTVQFQIPADPFYVRVCNIISI